MLAVVLCVSQLEPYTVFCHQGACSARARGLVKFACFCLCGKSVRFVMFKLLARRLVAVAAALLLLLLLLLLLATPPAAADRHTLARHHQGQLHELQPRFEQVHAHTQLSSSQLSSSSSSSSLERAEVEKQDAKCHAQDTCCKTLFQLANRRVRVLRMHVSSSRSCLPACGLVGAQAGWLGGRAGARGCSAACS